MALASLIALGPVVVITALLSGIFGMAGGMVLLWFLFLVAPASIAIAVHGIIQLVSNGSRAWFSRAYINYRIMGYVVAGSLAATAILASIAYSPNAAIASIVIGLLPLLLWIPKSWLTMNASRPSHALACGFISGGLTVSVGISGPTIDMFFVRTSLDRRTVIATKAGIQVFAHFTKVVFYWNAVLALDVTGWTAILVSLPLAVLGTWLGTFVLNRMSDVQFRSWTRFLVTIVGCIYLAQGAGALAYP
jgi:uncharacterized membrane protein YfcA